MIYGIGAPKFYVYDSTGVTLQRTISLSKSVMRSKKVIDRIDHRNTSPITRTKLLEVDGYYYKEQLSAGIGDYYSDIVQYQADQASDFVNDVYKLKQVVDYIDAGYVVKYTPHADLENLWGFSPFQVFVFLDDIDTIGRVVTDQISVTVEGTALRSSAFLWNEFSYTMLDGVTNANQCLSFNGTDEYATCTQFNCGKTHSVEFVTKGITLTGSSGIVVGEVTGGESAILFFGSTTMIYRTSGSAAAISWTHGVDIATRHHWGFVRSTTSVSLYVDSVLISTQAVTNNDFKVDRVNVSGVLFGGKIAPIRIYQSAITAAQDRQQYNRGYGNYPLDISAYAIWEMNGTGGTGTSSETDQSGNSRTLTLVNTPTRTTW